MANENAEVGYLTRDCVVKPGKDGVKGEKIERDVVGEEAWQKLAIGGALSLNKPETKSSDQPKRGRRAKSE